ncbi:hypothetical protein LR948_11140 [Roseivivax sp. GX 12232]|uniref:hypothetical protein n=1 Tax=Roseivivax sp. GX 12232 TaxID=2900547 RepID=UPI001E6093EB|nr:hypothetical protein [Roseivivax sp. GX 12232]MCE0505914.1 hypothetical protein [Roseivivax sp. GX 12232]
MLPFTRFHAATLKDLHDWSTLSRNEVGPFLARFGIEPLGPKYPILRVYKHLLGLSPQSNADDAILGAGLVRVTTVAGWLGTSAERLLSRLRTHNNGFPPLYAFGPHRHLLLKGQVAQMFASPKNGFAPLKPVAGHAMPASRLARHFDVPQSRIDVLLADPTNLPARVITEGRTRFIVSDVAHWLSGRGENVASTSATSQRAQPAADQPTVPKTDNRGGLFASAAAQAAGGSRPPRSCTRSASDAQRGDGLHRNPPEAKLSGA